MLNDVIVALATAPMENGKYTIKVHHYYSVNFVVNYCCLLSVM